MPVRTVVVVVLVILAVVFVLQNTGRGRVQFLVWTVDAPAWTWLVLTFAAGVVTGVLLPWIRRRRRRGRG